MQLPDLACRQLLMFACKSELLVAILGTPKLLIFIENGPSF